MRKLAVFVRSQSTRPYGIAVIASFVMHGLVVFVANTYLSLPSLGFEFQEPTEIEFGIADGADVQASGAAPAATPPPAEPPSGAANGTTASADSAADAGPRRHRDAGTDAGLDAGVDGSVDAGDGSTDAGHDPRPTVARATDTGRARIPHGGRVVLRFDFERIRQTELAPQIGELISTIEDFQAVISGSGLDAVNDLEQFAMASGNPWQRRKYMYVGRLAHDESWARERVAALAASKGAVAEWTVVDGLETARWYDEDVSAARVLVLLGDRYFILAPEALVPTARGWLVEMAGDDGGSLVDGAAMALGVANDEIISLETENIPEYLREEDREGAPRSGRVSIVSQTGGFDISIRADYPDATSAITSADILDGRLRELAGNRAVRAFGLDRMLATIQVRAEDARLRGHSELATNDVGVLVATAASLLRNHYEERAAEARRESGANTPAP